MCPVHARGRLYISGRETAGAIRRGSGERLLDRRLACDCQPAVRIEGFLTQLFVEPDVKMEYYVLYGSGHYIPEADIAVRLVAWGASFQAERRFYVKGLGEYMGGALESNFQLALDNSTRES